MPCGSCACVALLLNCTSYYDVDRNLCIDGGYEICAEMYNKNILVPLQTFVPKVRRESLLQFFQVSKIHTFV